MIQRRARGADLTIKIGNQRFGWRVSPLKNGKTLDKAAETKRVAI
jgi:hypothetical protein